MSGGRVSRTIERVVGTTCRECGNVIDADDPRRTQEGWMCADCYYAAIGEEIERHPIGIARRANTKVEAPK